MNRDLPDLCSSCGAELEDETLGTERPPCPVCGSTARIKRASARLVGRMTVSAEGTVRYSWDPPALTLFGVFYGILATAIGVIVAPYGLPGTAVYAVAVLVVFVACLLLLARPIIVAMRWLLEHGKG